MRNLINFISKFYGLIFFLILYIFIWTPLHEFLHISVLKFLDYKYDLSWNFFILPSVHCQDCDISNKGQMLFYNGFPYLIDLLVVLIGFFYENKLLRYFMHFGYFDIISNSFAMIIALITNLPNDFLNIIKLGFGYLIIILIVCSSYLWINKNKILLRSFIITYHSLNRKK